MSVELCQRNPSLGTKMTAIHFTVISCESCTAQNVQGKPYFCNICPCANEIVYVRFEDARTFLYILGALLKFSCAKNYG